ncbi:hypothetical protein B0O80DRAFT_379086, partial [Mortierella sp. GBAus27b]
AFWKRFWQMNIPHNARNVWWRLLIKKLPSSARLHAIIPTIAPQCRICKEGIETDHHMLFSCPRKLEVWRGALAKHFQAQEWTADSIKSLFYPQPPAFKTIKEIPKFTLLSSILATIWRYHHQSIREDEPFNSRQVLAAVDLEIGSLAAQYEEWARREARLNPPAPPVDNHLDNNNFPT